MSTTHNYYDDQFLSLSNYNKISYLVYDKNTPYIVKHKEFIPFAFFESIKIENFKLARSYMSDELSNKLSNAHLKKFFGQFLSVCLPLTQENFDNQIALIYEEKQGNLKTKKIAKIFQIDLDYKNKIKNIVKE